MANQDNLLPQKKKNILIVAGEASADLHGANLVKAMIEEQPDILFQGIGGRKMEEAGVEILVHSKDIAVVGLTEVFSKLSSLLGAYLKLKSILKNSDPALLILIDFPDFNIMLAGAAKRIGIPVFYYISPQVWAWRSGRVKKIAYRVDRMAVILPFEADLYSSTGLEVEYVGHPLMDMIPRVSDKKELLIEAGLDPSLSPVLGLVPGSRTEEIKNMLPVMISAAEILAVDRPGLQCIIPLATTIPHEMIDPFIMNSSLKISISKKDIYGTLAACDAALVTSGTATLETAIMETPMVILYKISPLSHWIGKRVINVSHIGLVNLVAGETVVPELIQDQVTPEKIAEQTSELIEGGKERENMIKKLKIVHDKLGKGGASEKAARLALKTLKKR